MDWSAHLILLSLCFAQLFRTLLSFSYGAPPSACNTMMPNPTTKGHNAFPNVYRPPPYKIRIYNRFGKADIYEYQPGSLKTLQVELSGDEIFRGFMLQARTVVGRKRAGQFLNPLPPGSKYLYCDKTNDSSASVTHSHNKSKQSLRFRWIPPAYNVGPIQFLATVVQSKELYWTNINSYSLHPVSDEIKVNTMHCGRGMGCFRLGAKNCQLHLNCNFTLLWKCTPTHILFDMFGSVQEDSSGTYIGLGFSNTKQNEEDTVLACAQLSAGQEPFVENYFIPYDHIEMILPRKGPSFKMMKTQSEDSSFRCRFSRKQTNASFRKFTSRRSIYFVYGPVYRENKFGRGSTYPLELNGKDMCRHSDIVAEFSSRVQSVLHHHSIPISFLFSIVTFAYSL